MPTTWRSLDDWSKARFRWLLETERHPTDPRPEQITRFDEPYSVLLYLTGRGWGKTRTAAEDVSEYARTHPGERIAGVFSTFSEGRDVGVEGDSGLLSCVPRSCVKDWNRSLGELVFANGARFDVYTAEKPDQLRGPQHHRAWVDELAKFPHMGEVWDQLQYGLRLGVNPQIVVTTTPRPVPLIRELVASPTTRLVRGSTIENLRNLSAKRVEELQARYAGTSLGRQELHGEIIDDYEGALWRRDQIDDHRVASAPELRRVVVGVDPSTWAPDVGGTDDGSVGHGIETGIVVAGIDHENPPHVYILEDLSGRYIPEEWPRRVVKAYERHEANAVVAEVNLGGMVTAMIRMTDPNVYIAPVRAMPREGKRVRAEPVALLYEQGRVHHVGTLPVLEDVLCSWDPLERWSPDRLDALVWAVTALNPVAHGPSGTSASQILGGARALR